MKLEIHTVAQLGESAMLLCAGVPSPVMLGEGLFLLTMWLYCEESHATVIKITIRKENFPKTVSLWSLDWPKHTI